MITAASLANVPLFKGLTLKQLEAILSVVKERNWMAGDTILKEGNEEDSMYILLSGVVEVSKRMTLRMPGQEEELQKSLVRIDASEPSVFGEMAMLNGSQRSATVTVVKACQTLEISRLDLERLCAADPSMGAQLFRNLTQILDKRLRGANQDIVKLATALVLALGK